MRYIPGVYQGVPNQREFRAAATGRPLQWDRSDRPAALAAYLNVAFRSMLTPPGGGVLYPARRAAWTAHSAVGGVWRGGGEGGGGRGEAGGVGRGAWGERIAASRQ